MTFLWLKQGLLQNTFFLGGLGLSLKLRSHMKTSVVRAARYVLRHHVAVDICCASFTYTRQGTLW